MSEPYKHRSGLLDIEALIAAEDDPKQRSFLIIMHSMHLSLLSTAATTREVNQKFDVHLAHFEQRAERDDALMNKGRGVWAVCAWLLGIAQVVMIAVSVQVVAEIRSLRDSDFVSAMAVSRIESRLDRLEDKK
jgi:hypothetical protein